LIDGDRVRWVGALRGAERDRLVAGAAAQLCPLQWEEPGGTGIVESLALGTPVVGYARGCLPELLDEGSTGLLVPRDDEDALADLLAARADRSLDRDACRAAARRRFTPAAMARGYLALYREVLELATGPARSPLLTPTG
jgi:glycosyltransferase involved in cell wall biosynthesis